MKLFRTDWCFDFSM